MRIKKSVVYLLHQNNQLKKINMKTFKDLRFKKYSMFVKGERQARENFGNGYGVSVLFGKCFYSNGIDTYEVAVLYEGSLCYTSGITDGVLGYLSKDEVSEIMIKVQSIQN